MPLSKHKDGAIAARPRTEAQRLAVAWDRLQAGWAFCATARRPSVAGGRILPLAGPAPWLRRAPVLVLAALLGVVARAAAPDAEFAMRWDPRQGGPATPVEVLQRLRLQPKATTLFEVQYFEFVPPAGLPEGFEPILRKRLSGSEAEWTFKLRGHRPLPAQPSLEAWTCPLGTTRDRKDEVDFSFVAADRFVKAYSRSCQLPSRDLGSLPPAALQARPTGCRSTMTRLRAGALKVEQWQLDNGTTVIEVSRPGHDTEASRRAFEREVLKPLLKLQVQPLERSKSALGGDCTR